MTAKEDAMTDERTAPDDVEEQNLPEGADTPDHPDFHPDLPDADSDEWQAQIALEDEA